MRFLLLMSWIVMMGCHQVSADEDGGQSGSLVFSLPEIKNTDHARLLSGYRLQIVKAAGSCSNPTSIDLTQPYESRKTIDVNVAAGCDYWLKLEAGKIETSHGLSKVYLSNFDDGTKGTLIESNKFSGRGVYRVRIPLKVTENGKKIGLDEAEHDPWGIPHSPSTNIQIDSYVDSINWRP